jgi:phage antirepressor YoqD-like protein
MRTYIKSGQVIQATENNKVLGIPTDLGNSDYVRYLADQKAMTADQLTAQTTAQATYDANLLAVQTAAITAATAQATALALTNQKLNVLGLTATDIANLLNAARG